MKVTYTRKGDYLLPDLYLEKDKNHGRLSEKSKELNPIEWTKLMNNYKSMAEEIVLNEYVFV